MLANTCISLVCLSSSFQFCSSHCECVAETLSAAMAVDTRIFLVFLTFIANIFVMSEAAVAWP